MATKKQPEIPNGAETAVVDPYHGEGGLPMPIQVFMRKTIVVVCIASYALSAIAFGMWIYTSLCTFLSVDLSQIREAIHGLLGSIEMLLIVPIPAIIGVVVYQTLRNISNPLSPDLERTQRQVGLAKNILAGLLVTVAGATLLDMLISDAVEVGSFLCGVMLTFALSVFIFVNRK